MITRQNPYPTEPINHERIIINYENPKVASSSSAGYGSHHSYDGHVGHVTSRDSDTGSTDSGKPSSLSSNKQPRPTSFRNRYNWRISRIDSRSFGGQKNRLTGKIYKIVSDDFSSVSSGSSRASYLSDSLRLSALTEERSVEDHSFNYHHVDRVVDELIQTEFTYLESLNELIHVSTGHWMKYGTKSLCWHATKHYTIIRFKKLKNEKGTFRDWNHRKFVRIVRKILGLHFAKN